jgi:hypothetical protein
LRFTSLAWNRIELGRRVFGSRAASPRGQHGNHNHRKAGGKRRQRQTEQRIYRPETNEIENSTSQAHEAITNEHTRDSGCAPRSERSLTCRCVSQDSSRRCTYPIPFGACRRKRNSSLSHSPPDRTRKHQPDGAALLSPDRISSAATLEDVAKSLGFSALWARYESAGGARTRPVSNCRRLLRQ